MLFKKHQSVYVLKYMNKYYKMASYSVQRIVNYLEHDMGK